MAVIAPLVEPLQLDLELACPLRERRSTGGQVGLLPEKIKVAGRVIQPTPVFDTYWRFAAERQNVYNARLAGLEPPWTTDLTILKHRFTNCYRAADRVSQYLIREVQYAGSQDPEELVFRTLLFKFFNKISTWELIRIKVGEPSWSSYDFDTYETILAEAFRSGVRLYSAAYVIPPPKFDETRKHANHLRLLELIMTSGAPGRISRSKSLQEVYEILLSFPAIGAFLAYQFAIDINYSAAVSHSEMDFVVAGPGARDGLRKCFGEVPIEIEPELIRYMAENQQYHFERLGLDFEQLGGVRPLQLVDCQNLFCEVDKYARVAHPEIDGISGRTRIKQKFQSAPRPLSAWFPPSWGI